MTTKDEALALALEALEAIDRADLELCEYVNKNLYSLQDMLDRAITAIKQAQQAPEGYKLVPIDATRNQMVTGWHAISGKLDHPTLAHLYGAMLAAAPNQG